MTFATTEAARAAHARAAKLHRHDVPSLLERGYQLIAQTRMRPFQTIAELGAYVTLLQGIRDSLDRFSLTVFERPLGELIQAHAPRRDAPTMSGANRRRLRRLSREYVRPGVHVPDMYEALVRIQQQRTEWQRHVDAGVTPEVPIGLADVHVAWQRVQADLAELDAVLGRSDADRLATLPVAQLVRTLGVARGRFRGLRQPRRARDAAHRSRRARTRAAARRAVGPARARGARRPPSWSSRGGSPPSSTCCAAIERCSVRTPRSSIASSATSGSSTRRTPEHPARSSPHSSRPSGASASSISPTRPRRSSARSSAAR